MLGAARHLGTRPRSLKARNQQPRLRQNTKPVSVCTTPPATRGLKVHPAPIIPEASPAAKKLLSGDSTTPSGAAGTQHTAPASPAIGRGLAITSPYAPRTPAASPNPTAAAASPFLASKPADGPPEFEAWCSVAVHRAPTPPGAEPVYRTASAAAVKLLPFKCGTNVRTDLPPQAAPRNVLGETLPIDTPSAAATVTFCVANAQALLFGNVLLPGQADASVLNHRYAAVAHFCSAHAPLVAAGKVLAGLTAFPSGPDIVVVGMHARRCAAPRPPTMPPPPPRASSHCPVPPATPPPAIIVQRVAAHEVPESVLSLCAPMVGSQRVAAHEVPESVLSLCAASVDTAGSELCASLAALFA